MVLFGDLADRDRSAALTIAAGRSGPYHWGQRGLSANMLHALGL